MELTTFRHFCAASRVLDVYFDRPDLRAKNIRDKLHEAVALSLRTENVCLPDHQHHWRMEEAFHDAATLADMLLRAVGAVDVGSKTPCLEVIHGGLFICANRLEDWQREVTAYQSPVPLMAAAWMRHCITNGHDIARGIASLHSSLAHSTLPSIHDPRLHGLIQSRDGTEGRLCDLHVHINGSTEFTPVWLHSLAQQDATCAAFEKARRDKSPTKVAFFQQQLRTDLHTIRQRLRMASVLRFWLCRLLHSVSPDHGYSAQDIPTLASVLALLGGYRNHEDIPWRHPFEHSLVPAGANDVQREGAMWLYALWQLHDTKDQLLAVLMHVYLLLMHQHMRLLVQQPEQYGFDQFQYITLAGGREAAEAPGKPGFKARFKQFHGMYGPDLAHVEARFSPKDTPEAMHKLLTGIWADYLAATERAYGDGLIPCPACPRIAEEFRIRNGVLRSHASASQKTAIKPFSLGLVAHFIKRKDDKKGPCRDIKLRNDIVKQAQALVQVRHSLRNHLPKLYAALQGKDAASNELDTPPEVFAPAFRYLNSEGITHTTYHAGEDFEHILCGIRAVYEAMYFLDMHSGDRIGHATALGIDPEQCGSHVVYCRQGQWLDSLVWLTWFMERTPDLRPFGGELALMQMRISCLYTSIYQEPCPQLSVLSKAWELRKYDVRLMEDDKSITIHPNSQREKMALEEEKSSAGETLYNAACKELRLYHNKVKTWEKWEKIICLPPEEQPSRALLQVVQDAVVREMHKKNILVEVLPTSNVRISHYTTTEEHHVMRWLNPEDIRPAPQVVLGTDDPGIFSTTLRNEYSLILRKLQSLHPGRSEKPYEIIRHLIENGLSYRFMSESQV